MAVHGAHIRSDPLCYGPDPLHCCTRSNNRFLYVLYSSCCCFMHLFTAMPPALRAASSRDLSVAGLLGADKYLIIGYDSYIDIPCYQCWLGWLSRTNGAELLQDVLQCGPTLHFS